MDERDFLHKLEERADEQHRLIKAMDAATFFKPLSLWLGDHPWRFLIPLSFLITFILHAILGDGYYTLILKIFGGFGILK